MRKLKIKVFTTLFVILSIFITCILWVNNYRNYEMQKKSILTALEKLPISLADINHGPKPDNNFNELPNKENNKIFLDSTVYTVVLDEFGNYKDLINHSENNISEDKIKEIANEIISNHKENIHVANLYWENYSYAFDNLNLTIIDNTIIHNRVLENLYMTILLFIILELLTILISYILTSWIIKPVILSFNKQKEFVEDASHELKTPLSVILASTDAYYLKKEDKWIDNIKNEANKMTKLVVEMLDLAKTEKNNQELYSQENISKIIEKCVLTFESMLFEKKIKLEYNIEENINLYCNKEQIERLVNILLDNAVNHSEKEGKIIVNLKKYNKEIMLEVKNKGLPIKKGEEKNIFERFYRVSESRNRSDNRYGLGLAIAKNIVENHNGKIEAFSNAGYTTFKINWNQK